VYAVLVHALVIAVIVVAVAVALGALPLGYWLSRRLRGVDIRQLSPHNLGVGTVAAATGPTTLALAVVLDLLKGAAGIAVASALTQTDWILAIAAAGVIAGHTYAPALAGPRSTARVKGITVAIGASLALAAIGAIPWPAVLLFVTVALAALALPRLAGRWGYLSLAIVLGAVAAPIALSVTGARLPYVVVAAVFALATIWNHKEHLLRIADGVEPRLFDRLPMPGVDDSEAVCAFLIHPMSVKDVTEARRFAWMRGPRGRGWISDALVRRLNRFVRPIKIDDVGPIVTPDGRRARVYLIGVPLLPDQIRGEPALAVLRAVQAADLAANLGARVMGLGAYWSVVGNKGVDVQARSRIPITNGGAYTAGTTKAAIPKVLARLAARGGDPATATAAVVGANGVVGFGICRSIVERVGGLVMVGTDQERLERSKALLEKRYPAARIAATTNLDALREADVVFTATSSPHAVVLPRHVKPGAFLFDLGRPPDVDPAVAAVPGVEVVLGGVVRLPGDPRGQIDLGYGDGLVPACLAETVILALDGDFSRVSLGDRTKAENIEYFVKRADEIGFEVQSTTATHTPGVPAPSPIPAPAR
jgi:predicted amino acid dehydrogenase